MLRFYQCRSAVAAQAYYTQGLAREDYYTQGQEILGRWCGLGAERLGLKPVDAWTAVKRAQFVALSENTQPLSGERLTQRTRADRTVGYDLNFHAPKGVSLLHALHGDARIMTVFRDAVHTTMQEIEADAATRVRKDGVYDDRRTGNLCWGEFVHLTARPTEAAAGPDPHLHAHCFVFNATFDETEQVWKAAQFQQLMRDAPYYEAAFHARFAGALNNLGYRVERTATGWDLAGVPRSLVGKFSTRTAEIESFAQERGITDPAAKGRLGAQTRKSKDTHVSPEELAARWDARLDADERALLARIARGGEGGDRSPSSPGTPPGVSPSAALRWSVAHTFARRSSAPLRRVVADALRYGVGDVAVDDVWRAVPEQGFLSRTVRGQELVTTRPVIEEERRVLEFAVSGRGQCTPFEDRIAARQGAGWEITDGELSPDQRAAVDHLLGSKDRVMAVRGAAGTGKTTMMREAVGAMRAGGAAVVVVAPLVEAARGENSLRTKGFPGADTVARLLQDEQMQRGLAAHSGQGVLWIDEAGLLGAKTLGALFQVATEHNARVVLCGDERQHKPVERGDALRILQRLGGIEAAELRSIRRQTGLYREAVDALSAGEAERGMGLLAELGAFREIEDTQVRHAEVAKDYAETLAGRRSALVVCPTHAEGRMIAAAIRSEQRARGQLQGEDRTVRALRDLGWSEAERADPRRYEAGMVLHYRQHAKGVVAGDKCEVLGIEQSGDGSPVVRGRTPRGVEVDLPLTHPDRFQVYRESSIELAVGDRIRLTREGRTTDGRWRLANRSVFTVVGFTKEGHIKVASDNRRAPPRVISKSFGHLTYGSVSTSHAAQGKDVDRVIVAMSAASHAAATEEQFYVSVSRGRRSVAVYTDDIAGLIRSVERSAARLSGMELSGESEIDPKLTGALRRPLDQRTALAAQIATKSAAARQSTGGVVEPKPPTVGRSQGGRKPPGLSLKRGPTHGR